MDRISRFAVIVAVALVAAGVGGGTGDARPGACTPGVRKLGKVTLQTYCGPASAVLRIRGRTLRFAGGSCDWTPRKVYVNVGTQTSGGTPRHRFFTAYVEASKSGRYRGGLVSWQYARKSDSLLELTFRIGANRTRGTFVGRLAGPLGGRATGSFRCR